MKKQSKPIEKRLPLDFEATASTELNILLCALRGGFTSEAVASFRALGVLMQDSPECHGFATIRIMDRSEAVDFLQTLLKAQKEHPDE